jgi:hypothetical protein
MDEKEEKSSTWEGRQVIYSGAGGESDERVRTTWTGKKESEGSLVVPKEVSRVGYGSTG